MYLSIIGTVDIYSTLELGEGGFSVGVLGTIELHSKYCRIALRKTIISVTVPLQVLDTSTC